ncbi:MAG TPA: hypothetical protein VFG83_04410 [Kofleriaceae bacterium]|nr:hypothetical protein [Kofleriaceae bacterium]
MGERDAAPGANERPVLQPSPRLVPPQPYVLAADGQTHLDLEEAGIFRPGGKRWAIVLGKALFWDQQAGSNGVACASCHFHAGADSRLRNQINPGEHDITHGPKGDVAFGSVRSDTGDVEPGHLPSGALASASYVLSPDDFPLHQLSDESNRNSPIITTTNDRISSQGQFAEPFEGIRSWVFRDQCGEASTDVFHTAHYGARQVEPRQSPSFINAVFNFRNFWDDRANNLFSGVGTFGLRDVLGDPGDPDDPRNQNRLIILDRGKPTLGYLTVENASLASQSLSPPLSGEMSCSGRTFADIGRKLVHAIPLRRQYVSHHDSVLGPFASPHGSGLSPRFRYDALIKKTFAPKYWAAHGRFRIEGGHLIRDPRGHTQMEINFSMFWGLAIQAYEATQVSDQSEFDALQASGRLVMTPSFAPGVGSCTSPTGDVDPLLVRGCTIFSRLSPSPNFPTPPDGIRGGNCFVCHNAPGGGVGRFSQPLLSEAAVQEGEPFPLFLTVTDVNGVNDLRDNGAANIGLRDVVSDLLSGGTDPYGNPLSFGRQYWNYLAGDAGAILDPPLARAIAAGNVPDPSTFVKLEADGAAKAPILRNVGLTPPYFNWGGYPSLRQVLKVYNRGMNRRDISGADDPDAHGSRCVTGDDSGTGPDGNHSWPIDETDCNTNTTGLIVPLGLSDCDANGVPNAACIEQGRTVENDDLAALARFLLALTDARVQCDQEPFDHPSLTIFVGHTESGDDKTREAADITFYLPAAGARGYSQSSGLCIPNAGDLFAPGMQARSGGRDAPTCPAENHTTDYQHQRER